MSKGKRVKKKAPFVDIYGVLLLVATLVMSIGYAEIVGTTITVETKAEASAQEGVFITDVVCNESNSVSNNYLATTLDSSITLDSPTDTKSFTITIYNKTVKPYVFVGVKKLDKWDEFTGVYNNTNISYSFGDDMVPHETIVKPKDWITFDVDLGFNGQGQMPETLRSLLNFSFQEVPTLEVVSEDTIENMYPNCEEQVYEFKVKNQRQDAEHGTITNGVQLTYTIAPNVPAPLTAKIYDSTGTQVAGNKAITISSENAEEHTYTMKVKWDNTKPEQGTPYNSAIYAGQTIASSINIIATPELVDGYDKYNGYILEKNEAVEIKTAPMYFGISTDKTTVEMNNTTNAEKMILTIKNNEGSQKINSFPVEYKLSIDNDKFTFLVDGSEIGEEVLTLGNNTVVSQEHEIQLVSKQDIELEAIENSNLTIEILSPYVSTAIIPLTIKDTKGPTAPVIEGGSTGAYTTTQTISVSEIATDVGTGVNKYQYLLNSTGTTSSVATADVTTTATSQTFTQDATGYYVYFRAVDNVGNVGEWSNGQQLYIDTQPPTVRIATGYEGEVKIKEGENNDIAKYFTYDKNGSAGIKEVTYTANGNAITNTNELTDGTYTIICTVIKETGLSASISKTIIVEGKSVYGTVYAVSDTEYHLVFNKTGKLAAGYTEDQRVYTTGDISGGASYNPWSAYTTKITKAKIEEEIKPQSCAYYFYNLSVLKEIENIENINTTNVTSMYFMFYNCSGLTSLDVCGFNTANVTNMQSMFSYCSSLTSVDVSWVNTAKVTNMSNMFYNCSGLTSVDVSGFNTEKVTNMSSMFYGCSKLTSLDVSGFDTTNVTNMQSMFQSCSGLTSLDVSGFNTINVTDMSRMFQNCSSLTSVDVSGFNTEKVTNMSSMFYGCSKLTSLDVSGFNTEKVNNMQMMFSSCSKLTSVDVSGFNTTNVTDMQIMFNGCSGLTSLDVSGFNTAKVTNMRMMFYECSGLTSLDVSGFNTAKVTDMQMMFSSCSGLTSLDVSGFNTANVTNMQSMFNGCSGLTSLDVSGFNTEKVNNMQMMFSRCSGLTSLDVSGFNTEKVNNMQMMFSRSSGLTSLDVSGFNTANVTNMQYMFSGCFKLNKIYAI